MRAIHRVLASCIFSVVLPGAALAQTFPRDDQWLPLTRDGVPITDPFRDSQTGRDVVGDANNPAAYVASNATHLFFRLRIDSSAFQQQNSTNYRPFGWVCELDTNGNLANYELVAGVDGIANPDIVEFSSNTQQTPNDPTDVAEILLANYPAVTHARSLPAPSRLGGSPDFFIDWAINIADLVLAGVTPITPLRFICGTSNNARTLNADLLSPSGATTLPTLGSDPVVCGPTGCSACNTSLHCGLTCAPCAAPGFICDLTMAGGTCVGCTGPESCSGTTPICDLTTGECRGCESDRDCGGATPACQPSGVCGQCSRTNARLCTGDRPSCEPTSGTCVECTSDRQCSGAEPRCDVANHTCVACLGSADCGGTTPVCNTRSHTCVPCARDRDCAGSTPACQPSGACGECSATNMNACTPATPICEVAAGECVECLTNGACRGATPVCDGGDQVCRGCTSDAECGGSTPACQPSGACGQCSATNARACPASAPVCDVQRGVCVPRGGCTSNTDCAAPTPICDTTGGICVGCLDDTACGGATPFCQASTRTCVGCLDNSACSGSTPFCNPETFTCSPCERDGAPSCTDPMRPACQTSGPLAGQCTECSAGEDGLCGGDRPECLPDLGTCGCSSVDGDSECGGPTSGRLCSGPEGVCEPGCSIVRNDCPPPEVCTSQTGSVGECTQACVDSGDCTTLPLVRCSTSTPHRCVECEDDSHCSNGRVCDAPGSLRCVECTATKTAACTPDGAGAACLDDLTCGCTTDTDCGGPEAGRGCDLAGRRCISTSPDAGVDSKGRGRVEGGGLDCQSSSGAAWSSAWLLLFLVVLLPRFRRR